MKLIIPIIGVLVALLGGLWLMQGLGVVEIQPILCFADCEPVEGPSLTWALLGAFFLVAGLATIVFRTRGRN